MSKQCLSLQISFFHFNSSVLSEKSDYFQIFSPFTQKVQMNLKWKCNLIFFDTETIIEKLIFKSLKT